MNYRVNTTLDGHDLCEYVSEAEGTDIPCAAALFHALHNFNFLTHGVDNHGDEHVQGFADYLKSMDIDMYMANLSITVWGHDLIWHDGDFVGLIDDRDMEQMRVEGITQQAINNYCISHPDYQGDPHND